MGTPSWAGPLTTSLRGLWVSGYLPRAMADSARGRRPENRPCGDDSDPGLATQRERGINCQQTCYSQTSVDCSILKGAGAQRPHCAKGRDPRTPASWRHLPLRVVAATSVAANPSNTTLRRRTILSDTIRVDVALLGYSFLLLALFHLLLGCGFPVPDRSFRKGKCCPIFVLGVPGLVAEHADNRLVTEDQRSLAFVSQFLLVSGLVWNRSDISVPRTCAMYTGWCPLAKHVPPHGTHRPTFQKIDEHRCSSWTS